MSEEKTAEQGKAGCFCMGAGPMFSDMMSRLGPDERVKQHFRNARIEVLKGLREMLDKRISELSRQAQPKGAKLTVE